MKTEGTNLLLLTISAFWSSSGWPLALPPRWALDDRKVSYQVVVIDRFYCIIRKDWMVFIWLRAFKGFAISRAFVAHVHLWRHHTHSALFLQWTICFYNISWIFKTTSRMLVHVLSTAYSDLITQGISFENAYFCVILPHHLGLLLVIWINLNPSMDKYMYSYAQ